MLLNKQALEKMEKQEGGFFFIPWNAIVGLPHHTVAELEVSLFEKAKELGMDLVVSDDPDKNGFLVEWKPGETFD